MWRTDKSMIRKQIAYKGLLLVLLLAISACESPFIRSGDNDAEFPGGAPAMQEYINNTIYYPQECIEQNISERIYAKFIVEKNGRITNIRTSKGNKLLRRETERVIRLMPRWLPATVKGKPVRARCRLPVIFELE